MKPQGGGVVCHLHPPQILTPIKTDTKSIMYMYIVYTNFLWEKKCLECASPEKSPQNFTFAKLPSTFLNMFELNLGNELPSTLLP